MDEIEKINDPTKKISLKFEKVLFEKYYMPYTSNELILLLTHAFMTLSICYFIYKGKHSVLILTCLFFIVFFNLFVLFFSYFKRFYIPIKTELNFSDNNKLVLEILDKHKNKSISLEKEGVYMLQLPIKKGKETLVIICKEKFIWINSYRDLNFYTFYSRNLRNFKKIIVLKSNR